MYLLLVRILSLDAGPCAMCSIKRTMTLCEGGDTIKHNVDDHHRPTTVGYVLCIFLLEKTNCLYGKLGAFTVNINILLYKKKQTITKICKNKNKKNIY